MQRLLLILVIGSALLQACSDKSGVPANIIQPEEMGSLLFDLNMAEDFVSVYVARDSAKNKNVEIKKEYQKVFLLHNVTEAQFETSYAFYRKNLDLFKLVMDKVNTYAQKKRNELYGYPTR